MLDRVLQQVRKESATGEVTWHNLVPKISEMLCWACATVWLRSFPNDPPKAAARALDSSVVGFRTTVKPQDQCMTGTGPHGDSPCICRHLADKKRNYDVKNKGRDFVSGELVYTPRKDIVLSWIAIWMAL